MKISINAPGSRPPRDPRHVELLTDNIRTNIEYVNATDELGLPADTVERLAEELVFHVDYAFDVRWAPKWIKPGDPHRWHDDEGWHARCNRCLSESSARVEQADALAWFDEHAAATHVGTDADTDTDTAGVEAATDG